MDEEQRIYTEQGVEEYVRYQLEHENEPFSPGPAFPFVKVSRVVPETTHTMPLSEALPGRGNAMTRGLSIWGKRPPSSGLMEPQDG